MWAVGPATGRADRRDGRWTRPPPGRNLPAMNRRLDRKLVALAAAYAVALNILLPVLGAVLPLAGSGAQGWAVLCSASGAADRGAPEKRQPVRPLCPCGAACAMPGCGATAL